MYHILKNDKISEGCCHLDCGRHSPLARMHLLGVFSALVLALTALDIPNFELHFCVGVYRLVLSVAYWSVGHILQFADFL